MLNKLQSQSYHELEAHAEQSERSYCHVDCLLFAPSVLGDYKQAGNGETAFQTCGFEDFFRVHPRFGAGLGMG